MVYKVSYLDDHVHKVDLIPFSGVVMQERRRSKMQLDIRVGASIKFAIIEQHGWILDDQGVERKITVKSAAMEK